MTITVRRSGGVAGLTRTWTVSATDGSSVAIWWPLVESCPWDAGDAVAAAGGSDRYVYAIRVDVGAEATAERDATVAETRLTGPWKDLVSRVRQESA
ncbi:protealysin inhibitor emfourin [Cnuibacter sp. UC19_7]|uniref:protealysin inhibitor emfourin n=1 Tax=Cnuibacter sp. UC19_7 TaxID=3350166 RepID=UPI00366F445B